MRTKGSKNLRTLDYCILYDRLVAEYGCPVEALFKIALGRYKPDLRMRAASALVNKRYPQQIAVKPEVEGQAELKFTWTEPDDADASGDTLHAESARPDPTSLN